MYFTKYPHRANFSFASDFDLKTGEFKAGNRCFAARIDSFEGDVHRLRIENRDAWGPNKCLTELTPPPESPRSGFAVTKGFGVRAVGPDGKCFLSSEEGAAFGVNADAWMFRFTVSHMTRFYGMGEKTFGRLELSGVRTKFWNTDVWGDFFFGQCESSATDPPYLSIPYIILKEGSTYVGILVHTGFPVFMETPGIEKGRAFAAWQKTAPELIIGAEGGQPDIWVIRGPSLKDLTRKLQRLVGVTPVPPLWSLGYHQCRWGYAGEKDLLDLDKNFVKTDIPCDAVWLDIDYMRGYRVFTVDPDQFPHGVESTAEKLSKHDRRIVAILDPGVKREPGFEVYDDGRKKGIFCHNPEGKEFVGIVWPGETVFPDFTLAEARDWWAHRVEKFALSGMGGSWLDMNDPSTGPVDPQGMLFNRGAEPHRQHRNQYALGMQMASRDGFLRARPNERPFLLSRSGSVGTSKYAAVWTGDNFTSYFYLKMAVPTSVNLSLSGVPFNGPDVGGFGGAPNEQLMVDWMKACFLFPFFRNHNGKGDLGQEPWVFSDAAIANIRKFIRLRYKLVPYLYDLFCDQEQCGDPVLRPLLYEFPGDRRKALEFNSDEFLVGPSILQAPLLSRSRKRRALLPGNKRWMAACSGQWFDPGTHRIEPRADESPMYLRDGAIIPMQREVVANKKNLAKVDVLVAADPQSEGEAEFTHRADDGLSFAYLQGKRSSVEIRAKWAAGNLEVTLTPQTQGFGAIDCRVLIPQGFKSATLNGEPAKLVAESLELSGASFAVSRLA